MPSADRLPILNTSDQSWRSEFVLTRDAMTVAERKMLATRAADGVLERIRRGVYRVPGPTPHPEDRLRNAVRAHHLISPDAIFSHRSAAAMWRLPRLGPWPDHVEILTDDERGGRSQAGIVRHVSSAETHSIEIEGVRVTSLVRTAVDLARSDGFASAVASVDASLRGIRALDGRVFRTTSEELLSTLDDLPRFRGSASARRAIEFSDGRAEQPGESLSRVQIARLGLEPPELQYPLWDDERLMEPDFFWRRWGVAGEFDGFGKYLRRHPDPGVSVVEAVLAEKRREDRMRRLPEVHTVVRWGWSIANDRPTLRAVLLRAGVR